MARQSWILVDRATGAAWNEDWTASGKHQDVPYSVRARTHRGGISEGVWGVELNQGDCRLEVLPSRGMNVWKARCGDVDLGWNSPVRGPVHPQFVPLSEPSGLGWLDGFDELLARCGLESNGAPEFDEQGRLRYGLHGRISNRPADRVEVTVDDESGAITVTGEVYETRFHFAKLRLTSTLSVRMGQPGWKITDRVTNLSATPAEAQMLYHINLGLPLLDAGSRVVLPARRVVPRTADAARAIDSWDHFQAERPGFAEQVYFFELWPAADGRTEALLRNAHGTRGFSVLYRVAELPFFSLWKDTAAAEDGYVTGLEPGTNFPNPRSFERRHNRHVRLEPGASCEFDVECQFHRDANAVRNAERRVEALKRGEPEIHSTPLAEWCA